MARLEGSTLTTTQIRGLLLPNVRLGTGQIGDDRLGLVEARPFGQGLPVNLQARAHQVAERALGFDRAPRVERETLAELVLRAVRGRTGVREGLRRDLDGGDLDH